MIRGSVPISNMLHLCVVWICMCLHIHYINGNSFNLSPKMITVINDTNEWNSFNSTDQSSLCVCHVQSLPHCECFEDVLSQMHSNTIVNITIPNISLSSNIELRDIHDITIIGHNNPEITCTSTGTLKLNNCSNIVIRNVIWRRCGDYNLQGVFGRNNLIPWSRLQFHFGTNITIQRSAFIETYIKMYEVSGNVDINEVHFSGGVNQGEFSFGGLFIEYSKQVKSTVSVNDSIFANTAPNRFGGQLFEVKAINSTNFSLRIANSIFANGSNYLGPEFYYRRDLVSISMHTSWNFSFANVIFTNVTFDSNTFIDGSIVSISNNYNLHLSSCLFHNNTASNIMFFNVESIQLQRSKFQYNNGKSALVSVMYSKLIRRIRTDDKLSVVSFSKLIFTSNVGGPFLSVNRYIKIKFQQLQFLHNVLQSGHGLVVVSDYYHLSVTVSNVKYKFNQILTKGSAFYCSSSTIDMTKPPYPISISCESAVHVSRRHSRGIQVFTTPEHKLHLINTIFEHNRGGGHGAGVYISHPSNVYCPIVGSYTIKNSKFNNISDVNSVVYYGSSNYSRYTTNVAIKDCVFTNNVGTALYLVNSNLIFDEGVTLFEKNTAEHGGALYLDLNSKLTFATQSDVIFNNNQAIRYGGVMYCNVLPSNNCYRNVNNILEVMNSTNIQFNDNVAVIGGSSVFFSVSSSCDGVFQSELNITKHVLGEQIVTSPVELRLDPLTYLVTDDSEMEESGVDLVNNSTLEGSGIVPIKKILEYPTYSINSIMLGQDIAVPACVVDDNGKPAGAVSFSVVPISGDNIYNIEGDIIYSLSCMSSQGISNLQVTGKEPIVDTNPPTITIQFHSLYDTAYAWTPIIVNLRIELSPCHSGFQYDNHLEKCICYDRGDTIQCSGSSAKIRSGYWFGVVDKQTTVGICPVNYCNLRNCEGTTTFCPLPSSPDDQCGEHRLGIACGECVDGYSLSFDSVICVNNNKCAVGQTTLVVTMTILYWIVTVVVVFAIMYFKVGIWNFYSITFYHSVADILLGQVLHTSDTLYRMVTIISSLARLTPQFLGELCFVKGLSGIDQQFIHYIHPLAVLVILLLISISTRFSKQLSLFVSRGIIHVICFLLLLSYTSIASTSLLLMRPLTFTGVNKVFTYLSPHLGYFNGRHLVYGLVAIACGLVVAIGLPLLLLLEPFLNHKINFTRFKPLLDQFQGCYKDKYRCFASYYMICRLVLLIIVNINVTNTFTKAYIQLVVLVIIVLVHFTIRPYTSKTLNTIDGLILLVMILVTALQPIEAANGFTTNVVTVVALTLLVLPLFMLSILITPFIKQLISLCLSTIQKVRYTEGGHDVIEIPSNEYEITVDQTLRDSTPTTIIGALKRESSPVSFQESLLELGIG